MSKFNARNHRNNPYLLDNLLAPVHRTAAGVLWRFRTETLTTTVLGTGTWLLAQAAGVITALIIIANLLALTLVLTPARRFLIRRAWCVLSRHRLQRVFFETRMHTRSGRLPLILRIHPTEVGEQALIWCRAGICFEDLEAHTGEIAAACYAREARTGRSKRWAQLVTVDIVRRDTLAAHHVITSGLAATPVRPAKPGTDLDIAS